MLCHDRMACHLVLQFLTMAGISPIHFCKDEKHYNAGYQSSCVLLETINLTKPSRCLVSLLNVFHCKYSILVFLYFKAKLRHTFVPPLLTFTIQVGHMLHVDYSLKADVKIKPGRKTFMGVSEILFFFFSEVSEAARPDALTWLRSRDKSKGWHLVSAEWSVVSLVNHNDYFGPENPKSALKSTSYKFTNIS